MFSIPSVLAATSAAELGGAAAILALIGFFLIMVIFLIVAMMKVFSKMGYKDTWFMIIPILNIIFMLRVAQKPIWWIVLLFVPFINNIVGIYLGWLVADKVAKAYHKETLFAVGLLLLGFVFYPILAFSDIQPDRVGENG